MGARSRGQLGSGASWLGLACLRGVLPPGTVPAPQPMVTHHLADLQRAEGMHAVVPLTIVPDGPALNVLSPSALFPFKWEVHYSGSEEGCTWEIPGIQTYRLQRAPGKAHAYVSLVRVAAAAGHPEGVTIFDEANPLHRGLRRYDFIIDTGAESSLVLNKDRGVLTRPGGFNGVSVEGIGGRIAPLGGGMIDFVFPG